MKIAVLPSLETPKAVLGCLPVATLELAVAILPSTSSLPPPPKVEGAEAGVLVDDSVGSGVNSRVHLIHCTMEIADVPLTIWGNGTVNTGKTTVLVEKSKLDSRDYVGIMGNGSALKVMYHHQFHHPSILIPHPNSYFLYD